MIPPGLLPETPEPRRSSSSWVLAAVVCAALVAVLVAVFQIRRLARERDHAVEQFEAIVRKGPPPAEPAPVRPVDPPWPPPE